MRFAPSILPDRQKGNGKPRGLPPRARKILVGQRSFISWPALHDWNGGEGSRTPDCALRTRCVANYTTPPDDRTELLPRSKIDIRVTDVGSQVRPAASSADSLPRATRPAAFFHRADS